MVLLPAWSEPDPTLEEADRQLEARARAEKPRTYLGMSSIGHPCSRKLWYDYHDPIREDFSAATLKRFDDGHRSEDIAAFRLRMVPGVELWTVDPVYGKQFEVADFDDRFKGHLDGAILGIYQAPKTWHVWEAKTVNEKKFAEFKKLKALHGQKATMALWDEVYYAQAQCYMGYTGMTRHYLTVSTPSVRDWDSCRTEFDLEAFIKLKDKARRILEARAPLAKVSENPAWYVCKMCKYQERCHGANNEIGQKTAEKKSTHYDQNGKMPYARS